MRCRTEWHNWGVSRITGIPAAVTVVFALAGCAQATDPIERPAPQHIEIVPDQAICPDERDRRQWLTDYPPQEIFTEIPATRVVWCRGLYPDGEFLGYEQWESSTTVDQWVAEVATTPPTPQGCQEWAQYEEAVLLVDDNQSAAIHVRIPRDSCTHYSPTINTLLNDGTAWTKSSHQPQIE